MNGPLYEIAAADKNTSPVRLLIASPRYSTVYAHLIASDSVKDINY